MPEHFVAVGTVNLRDQTVAQFWGALLDHHRPGPILAFRPVPGPFALRLPPPRHTNENEVRHRHILFQRTIGKNPDCVSILQPACRLILRNAVLPLAHERRPIRSHHWQDWQGAIFLRRYALRIRCTPSAIARQNRFCE
jgi:hypothetical protein